MKSAYAVNSEHGLVVVDDKYIAFFAQIYTFYPTFGRKSFVISKLLCIFAPKLRHEVVQIIVL